MSLIASIALRVRATEDPRSVAALETAFDQPGAEWIATSMRAIQRG
jgi:hypothetical protein